VIVVMVVMVVVVVMVVCCLLLVDGLPAGRLPDLLSFKFFDQSGF